MLDLHWQLMLVVLAIFFFLIYQLNNRLYGPLIKFVDDREESIARDLKESSALSGDSEELLEKARGNLDSAKNEAARMRHEAIEKIKEESAAALEEKQSELEKEYERFVERLAEEKKSLQSALLSQLPLIKEGLKAKFSQI